MTKLLGILLAFLWFFAVIQGNTGAIPVLFPYQLRFTSGLSPVFLWLGLVEEGGCLGGETEVLPDLTLISPSYRFMSSP